MLWQAAPRTPRQIRQRYHLQKRAHRGELQYRRADAPPAAGRAGALPAGNTFVVKAHAGPTPLALALIRLRLDPPDLYLSRSTRCHALGVWKMERVPANKGRTNAFTPLVDFDAALDFMLEYRAHLGGLDGL